MTTPFELTFDAIDAWIDDEGPVALCLSQRLDPAEGVGAVFYPPTYAPTTRGSDSSYNIDELHDKRKVVIVDSVGSQANRIEPIFKAYRDGTDNFLSKLVPQVSISYGDKQSVSILDIGHRIGDAFVRSSSLGDAVREAFATFLENGDCTQIAKLAPTSLVFGAWDSRGTQAKLPRIVQAEIRAWDVDVLTRSAQYAPPIDYSALDVFSESEKEKAEGDPKSPLAQRGFVHVPAPRMPGGCVAHGDIARTVSVNLVALRRLWSESNTRQLRSYILGLALVSATEPQEAFLRQGCMLVPAEPARWLCVARDGNRTEVKLDRKSAYDYACNAADAFGVGEDRTAAFEQARAKSDVTESKKKKQR